MKFFGYFGRGIEITVRVLYLILSLLLIAGLMYIVGGHLYLKGFWGTDTGSVISMLVWVDKYFPKVPFWYPLAGGGVSLTHSYPVFSLFLATALERISSLNLIQSLAALGFSSVLIFAISLYFYVAIRFKNQTAALLASVFYVLSPIAWTWLTDWGFYAEAVSHIFVVPAIAFWDLFFTSFLEGRMGLKERIFLALAVVFLSLTIVTHFGAGLGVLGFFAFYVVGFTIKRKPRKQTFVRGVVALTVVTLLTLFLTASTIYPFYRYSNIASQAANKGGLSYEQIKLGELSPLKIIGIQGYTKNDFLFPMRHFVFPLAISIFAFIGALGFFRRPHILSFVLFAVFSLLVSTSGDFNFWVSGHIPWFLAAPFGWRHTFVPLRAIWPALAGLGVTGLISLPFFSAKCKLLTIPKGIIVALLAIILSGYSLYRLGGLPRPEKLPYNFGASGLDLRNIWQDREKMDLCLEKNEEALSSGKELVPLAQKYPEFEKWCNSPLSNYFPALSVADWCFSKEKGGETNLPSFCFPEKLTDSEVYNFWQGCKKGTNASILCSRRFLSLAEQLAPRSWPPLISAGVFDPNDSLAKALKSISQQNPSARIDFSPYISSFSMIAPFYYVGSDLSQIHHYVTSASLVQRFQGRQQIAYYLNDPAYKIPELINNTARWFGLNYIFYNEVTDMSVFKEAGWEDFESNFVLKYSQENGLAELSNRPAVLTVSQARVDAYDQVFELANFGVLPYNDYLLVWGKEKIDDYTLEELKNFKIVLLHGYRYGSKTKANKLLSDYVKGGGSVFIDTGWQYVSPDWESEEALEIIPLKSLSWKSLGKTSDYYLQESEVGKDVDGSLFAPLIYSEVPWNVSTSDAGSLKDGSQVVLSAFGSPLVVTRVFGKGRIVWSGMNIFPHAKQKNQIFGEEVKFLKNIFSWLGRADVGSTFGVGYKRINPDNLEFTFEEDVTNGAYLMFKEAAHPDFKATLASSGKKVPLKIEKAGPGWILMRVPKVSRGDKVLYSYQKPLSEAFLQVVSIAGVVFLFLLILDTGRGEKSFFSKVVVGLESKVNKTLFGFIRKPFGWLEKGAEDEY